MGEELRRVGAAPLRISGREMAADVAGADRAENGIGQGMQADIGVGVAFERLLVGDADATDGDAVAGGESMHVVTRSRTKLLDAASDEALGAPQIVGSRDLEVVVGAHHQRDGEARRLGDGGIVGHRGALSLAMGGQDIGIAERLRRLRPPQAAAIDRAGDAAALRALQRIGHRNCDDRPRCVVQRSQCTIDDVSGEKGAGGIMDENAVRPQIRQALETIAYRVLAAGAAGHGRQYRQAGDRAVIERPMLCADDDADA